MNERILVVDDEESIRYTFSEFLQDAGYQVDVAETLDEALDLVGAVPYELVFLDILLGRESGIELLRVSKERNPNCPVIMITGSPEIDSAAESVRLSAFDYLTKPVTQFELLDNAERALAFKRALDDKERYQQRMTAVFRDIKEGIMVFDEALMLIEMNDAAVRMTGLPEGAAGQSLASLIKVTENPVVAKLQELLEARFEGELFRLSFTRDNGEPLLLSVRVSPLRSANGLDRDMVVVIWDESENVKELA